MRRPTHIIEDLGESFFLILIALIPHKELEYITEQCRIYKVDRKYVRIDGNICLAVCPRADDDGDFNLMEMWCSIHLKPVGVWRCPVCRDRYPEEHTCGHMVRERLK